MTQDIPDKICPHCGGTKWIVTKQGWFKCDAKVREQNKIFTAKNKLRYDTDPVYRAKRNKISQDSWTRRKAEGRLKAKYISPEKSKEYSARYYAKHKDEVIKRVKLRSQNPDVKQQQAVCRRKKYAEYTIVVVKRVIQTSLRRYNKVKVKTSEIPLVMAEAYRQSTLLKRQLKQLTS